MFWPQHGEYANQTVFVLSANAADAMEFNLAPRRIDEFAIFSDGIERMVLHGATKAVNDSFFDQMFVPVRASTARGLDQELSEKLKAYIETAEDIVPHRLYAVPGFGPKMIERLMEWRRSIEAKFVFNPAMAIDPRDIARVEQDILTLRTKTEAAAKAACAEAMQTHARILAARPGMRPQMDALQAAVAQARADYEFVKG